MFSPFSNAAWTTIRRVRAARRVVYMDAQLATQLGQTIRVAAPSTTVNNYGEITYATATTMAARIVGEQTKLFDTAGQELMSSHKLITTSVIKHG